MPNVLDLQGLPENVQAMAETLTKGACISLVSVVERLGAVPASDSASEANNAVVNAPVVGSAEPMGACISLVSYVGSGSGAI